MLANGGGIATRRIGGNDDGTRGQHHRRKYVGYLFVVSHMLAMAEGQVVVTVMSMVTKTLT